MLLRRWCQVTHRGKGVRELNLYLAGHSLLTSRQAQELFDFGRACKEMGVGLSSFLIEAGLVLGSPGKSIFLSLCLRSSDMRFSRLHFLSSSMSLLDFIPPGSENQCISSW